MEEIFVFFKTLWNLEGFHGAITKNLFVACIIFSMNQHYFTKEYLIIFAAIGILSLWLIRDMNRTINDIAFFEESLINPEIEDVLGVSFENYFLHAEQMAYWASNVFYCLIVSLGLLAAEINFNSINGYTYLVDLNLFLFVCIFTCKMSINRVKLALRNNFDFSEE